MPGGMTAPEATAATTVTAESPASFAAATVAVLEAALAAASMAPPSGASTTLNLFLQFFYLNPKVALASRLYGKNQEIPSDGISHIWPPLSTGCSLLRAELPVTWKSFIGYRLKTSW